MGVDPHQMDWVDPVRVRYQGRILLWFGGSDYLRMSWHPALLRAARRSIRAPMHPGASRRTTGENADYLECERVIAGFFGVESALLVSSGYLAPMAVVQGFREEVGVVLVESLAHACIADAAGLSGRPVHTFPTGDVGALRRLVVRVRGRGRVLVLCEGVWGSRGGHSPVDGYLEALPESAWMMVDDAHGVGVVGPGGRGLVARLGIRDERVVQTMSLAKAVGAAGGAVVGSEEAIGLLRRRASAFIGSTSPPHVLVAMVRASILQIRRSSGRVTRLQSNASLLRSILPETDEISGHRLGPVTVVTPGTEARRRRLQEMLLARGVYPPYIQYLAGPKAGFYRFSVCALHTAAQVRSLGAVLKEWAEG